MFEGNAISLNICNTPCKETQLPSIWTGTLFIWREGFTHHKENCTFPEASHLKGKLHIPKEYLRMFSIQYFFDSGVWRMHLIDTWCLRGQMNQIWLGLIWINSRDQILEQNRKKKQKKKFWETYFGMGEGEKALQCIGCFLVFCFALFLQIADSRWLTSQWNSQCHRKKARPWWGGEHLQYVYIYIYIYTYIHIYIYIYIYIYI